MIVNIKHQIKHLQEIIDYNNLDMTSVQVTIVENLIKNPIGGIDALMLFLLARKMQKDWKVNHIDGLIYETLLVQSSPKFQNILIKVFGSGVVVLESQRNIDYLPLQNLLIRKQFKAANALTHNTLRQLSSLCDNDRSWLYFTDILSIPAVDLHTIDNLWRIHSLNKFGFSVQRRIWLSNNKDCDKLWNAIGWQINHVLCRYPNEFQWDISGPIGHLPLFNQLYGIQPMLALFQHKAWKY